MDCIASIESWHAINISSEWCIIIIIKKFKIKLINKKMMQYTNQNP